tara:strand:+ start:1265 stop:1741 length:477 start_codon:yes stop_codon:yes gene_type:complete
MATYQSDAITGGVVRSFAQGLNVVPFTASISAAAANSDVVELVEIPAHATVVDFLVQVSDIDTNGSPTVTIDIGDDGDPDRFVDASIAGRAGGAITPADANVVLNSVPYQNTDTTAGVNNTSTTFKATILTVATGATGTVSGYVAYSMMEGIYEEPSA